MAHIIEKLRQDHEKVAQIFEKLANAEDGKTTVREALCQQLINEIEAHAEFEEQVFYPAIQKASDDAADEVEEAIDEHDEVKDMLEQLKTLDSDDDEIVSLLEELQEAVAAHVQHEETDIFPLAQEELEDTEAREMAQKHDSMAKAYMEQHAGR